MESDLLEISREDDSLLVSNEAVSASPASVVRNGHSLFTCSPLLRSESSMEGKIGNGQADKMNNSLRRDDVTKENITNANKGEAPKLSVDPQPMKRKKKGAGYNLRKSLAWDRAFFTEEGVLDPTELSMITGCSGNLNGEMSVIEEEDTESLSCCSPSLQTLEENLFKLPANASKRDSDLLLKHDGSAIKKKAQSSSAKHNVASTCGVNCNGSKRSGCPRPMASSSLKRPASVNPTKALPREMKISRIPVSKSDQSSVPFKGAMAVEKQSRHSMIAQRERVQKGAGSKGSSVNAKSTRNTARVVPNKKVLTAKGNLASSPLEACQGTRLLHPPIAKANIDLQVPPDPGFSASSQLCNDCDDGSRKIASALSKTERQQHAQLSVVKPSGLRKPSPSLRFFDQPKTSSLQGTLPRGSQLSDLPIYSVPQLEKGDALNLKGDQRSAPATGKTPESVSRVSTNRNTQSSCPSSLLCSVIPSFHEKIKTNLDTADVHKRSRESVGSSKSEIVSLAEDVEFQGNNNKLLLRFGYHEQLKNLDDTKRATEFDPKRKIISGGASDCIDLLSVSSPIVQFKDAYVTEDSIKCQHKERKNNADQRTSAHDESKQSKEQDKTCEFVQIFSIPSRVDALASEESEGCAPDSSCPRPVASAGQHCAVERVVMGKWHFKEEDRVSSSDSEALVGSLDCIRCKYDSMHSGESISDLKSSLMAGDGEITGGLMTSNLKPFDGSLENRNSCGSLSVENVNFANKMSLDDNQGYKACSGFLLQDSHSSEESQKLAYKNAAKMTSGSGDSPSLLQQTHIDETKNEVPEMTSSNPGESPSILQQTHAEEPKKVSDICDKFPPHTLDANLSVSCLDFNMNPLPHSEITIVDDAEGHKIEHSDFQNPGFLSEQVARDKQALCSIKKCEVEIIPTDHIGKETATKLTKFDALTIKPPPNAIPFSEEWLAAFEAAGEDILSIKSGAVQNSPPDKSLPEPGPWSPVKRKNNLGVGPFDCTKYTSNTSIPHSDSH